MARVCPNCGKPLRENAQFCPGCGKSLGAVREEVSKNIPDEKKKNNGSGSKTLNIILTVTMIIQLAVAGFRYPGFLAKRNEPERPQETARPANTSKPQATANTNNDDPIQMEWPYHSKALDFTPAEGIRITAEEGQLFDDTVLSFTPIEEDPDGRIMEAYEELREQGIYIAGAWEADAGLEGDQSLPGVYSVELDLEKLDIPEEMYEYVQIYRLSDDNELTQYSTSLSGKTLTYSSNNNCPIFVTIGTCVAIAAGGYYATFKWIPRSKKEGYLNETRGSHAGHTKWGDYTVNWNMDYMAPDQTDIAIRMLEIQDACRKEAEEDYKLEEERQKLAPGSFMWFFKKNIPIPQRMKKLLDNNSEYQDLKQLQKLPKNVQVICKQIETAMEFLMDRESIRKPNHTVDFMIQEKDPETPKNLGSAVQPWNYDSYIILPVPKPDWLTADTQEAIKYKDNMLLTVTHELFHICQEAYHTRYFTDSVSFDEMTAVTMEGDAKEYYQLYDKITTDPNVTYSEYALTMINPIDSEPWFSRLFLQHQGYYLSKFVRYLREKTGNNVSVGKIMRTRSYRDKPVISKILASAFDLSETQFEAAFRKFMISEAENLYRNYDVNLDEKWFEGWNPKPVSMNLNVPAHYEMSSQGSYSALIRTFVVQDEKKEVFATLIVPDAPPKNDRVRVNIVPVNNKYTATSFGAFIPANKRIMTTAPKRFVCEIYGNQEGKNGEMGYTVWAVTAPKKPELSLTETDLIIQLPEPIGAAKAGLIDGMRVNITVNEETTKTVMVEKTELGTERRIPLDDLKTESESDFNVRVTLEEFVLSKKGEKLYCPISEEASLPTEDRVDWVLEEIIYSDHKNTCDACDAILAGSKSDQEKYGLATLPYCSDKQTVCTDKTCTVTVRQFNCRDMSDQGTTVTEYERFPDVIDSGWFDEWIQKQFEAEPDGYHNFEFYFKKDGKYQSEQIVYNNGRKILKKSFEDRINEHPEYDTFILVNGPAYKYRRVDQKQNISVQTVHVDKDLHEYLGIE